MGLINVRDPLNVIPICLNIHSLTSITKAEECQAWYFCNPLSRFRPLFNYTELESDSSLLLLVRSECHFDFGDSRDLTVNQTFTFDCDLLLWKNKLKKTQHARRNLILIVSSFFLAWVNRFWLLYQLGICNKSKGLHNFSFALPHFLLTEI